MVAGPIETIAKVVVGISDVAKAAARVWLTPDAREERDRRRLFAGSVKKQIGRLNERERWHGERFTELEAEIELYCVRRRRRLPAFPRSAPSRVRRERSLTKALARSSDRVVLLQGDPGSGKSVALRHLAETRAAAADTFGRPNSTIPLYINLKNLRPRNGVINCRVLRDFVFQSLNPNDSPEVSRFLEDEFEDGLRRGRWLFLFDSFDEIPEILAAVEADATVDRYSSVLFDFIASMSRCRGIIASREYRGPREISWPRFRITPLSESRKQDLINRAHLSDDDKHILLARLPTADRSTRELSGNPLFLALVCEYVRTTHTFPANSHEVFENYLRTRLERDRKHLKRACQSNPDEVRRLAEEVAFCMWAEPNLGLSATRSEIASALERRQLVPEADLTKTLDALERLKLGRSDDGRFPGETESTFTFAHRRFHEYFATCMVLRHPDLVPDRDLLTNGRWRETAVAICQTQPREAFAPLMAETEGLLDEYLDGLVDIDVDKDAADSREQGSQFVWPPGALHLLELLDAGLARPDLSPGKAEHADNGLDTVRRKAGRLLLAAGLRGRRHDRKWALDAAGAGPPTVLLRLVRAAFRSDSAWLRGAAFRQIGRLPDTPADVAGDIRKTLTSLAAGGQLRKQRATVTAELKRLDGSDAFVATYRRLRAAPVADALFHLFVILVAGATFPHWDSFYGIHLLALVASSLGFYTFRLWPPFAWPDATSRTKVYRPLEIVTGGGHNARALLAMAGIALVAARMLYILGWLTLTLPPGHVHVLPALLVLYALTWAPATLVAIHSGVRLRLSLWLVPHASAGPFARRLTRDAIRKVRPLGLRKALIGSGLVMVWAVTAFVLQTSMKATTTTEVVYSIVMLGSGTLLATMVATTHVQRFLDRRRLRARPPEALSCGRDLLTSIDELRSTVGVIDLIRMLRRSGWFDQPTPGRDETILVLSDLIMVAEHLQARSRDPWSTNGRHDPLKVRDAAAIRELDGAFTSSATVEWLRADGSARRFRRLKGLSAEALDEMSEVVSAARELVSTARPHL